MKRIAFYIAASSVIFSLPLTAQEGGQAAPPADSGAAAPEAAPPKFEGENKELGSYFMGYQAGYSLKRMLSQQGMGGVKLSDLDADALVKGLQNAINGDEPAMDTQKSMSAIQGLQAMLQKRDAKVAAENRKAGDAYRAERAKEEGIVTTESGLMYKIKEKGDGEVYEAPEGQQMDMQTRFQVRYTGRLIDGTEFDSSGDQPATFDLRVVPGFSEALRMMPTGSTWELILKPELAYGDERAGGLIEPGSTLVFDLTLEEIVKPAPPKERASAVTPPIQIPPAPREGGQGEARDQGGKKPEAEGKAESPEAEAAKEGAE